MTALNALLNLLLLAAGLPATVAVREEDEAARCLAGWQQGWAQRGQLDYPLAQRVGAKRQSPLHRGYAEWWERLAQDLQHGAETREKTVSKQQKTTKRGIRNEFTSTVELGPAVIDWLIVLSGSGYRPLRHVATLACLHWVTGLSRLCVQLSKELDRLTRLQSASKAEEVALQSAQAEQQVQSLFEAVFVQRFRDCCPQIRQACLVSLTRWIEGWPEVFLDNGYLRYLGWALSDRQGGVRLEAIRSWQTLYQQRAWLPQLASFLDRFRERLEQMALRDADPAVRKATMLLLGTLVEGDALELDAAAFLSQAAEPDLLPKALWRHCLFAGGEPSLTQLAAYLNSAGCERAEAVAKAVLAAFPTLLEHQQQALSTGSHPAIIKAALQRHKGEVVGISKQMATTILQHPEAAWWNVAQLLDWEAILLEVGEAVILQFAQRLCEICLFDSSKLLDSDLSALSAWLKRLLAVGPLSEALSGCIAECVQACLTAQEPLAEHGRPLAYLLGLVRIPLSPQQQSYPLPAWRRALLQELAWSILEERGQPSPNHERIELLRDLILDHQEPHDLDSLAISLDCATLLKRAELPSLWSTGIRVEQIALDGIEGNERVRAIIAVGKMLELDLPCQSMLADCFAWLDDLESPLKLLWRLAQQRLAPNQVIELVIQRPALSKWMLSLVKEQIEQFGPLLPTLITQLGDASDSFVPLLTAAQTKELMDGQKVSAALLRQLNRHWQKLSKRTPGKTTPSARRPSRLRELVEEEEEESEEDEKHSESQQDAAVNSEVGKPAMMMMTSEDMSAPSSPLRMIRKRIVRL